MASFWKNQPEMTGYNGHKNTLKNIISSVASGTPTKTKIEHADKLNSQNELEKAYEIYKDILGDNPVHADALLGIGIILEKQQKFDLAIQFLSKAIESDPGKIKAVLTRGRIFRLQGELENAILDFTTVIEKHPHNFRALIARGIALGQTSQFNAAFDDFSLASKIRPNCAEAFYNRGVVHEKLHQFTSAIKDYSIAIKLNPHDHKAYNNRGVARRESECFDAALKDFDKCVEINPNFAEGYYNKSLTLLSVGNLEEGFKLYEYRWKTAHFQPQIRNFSQPLWLGDKDLTGKTILLHSEQGLGDSIQFCRYIKFFENIKCRVLLEIEQPLMSLMQSLLPNECIIEKGSPLPKFDCQCPLMSLPYAFRTVVNNIPLKYPYLTAHQNRIEHWQKLLNRGNKPIVGIAWRGNPNHVNDLRRSARLIELLNFLSKDFEWISLEKFPTDEEKCLINETEHIKQFSDKIVDFADTAALCRAIDAVISVDTSVAHLAASVGSQTHLLIRSCADWRWFQHTNRSPWYNSMRLHRKPPNTSWSEPLQKATEQIRDQRSRVGPHAEINQ
jgi:tetratricopeptide (TPR) repeat protein